MMAVEEPVVVARPSRACPDCLGRGWHLTTEVHEVLEGQFRFPGAQTRVDCGRCNGSGRVYG